MRRGTYPTLATHNGAVHTVSSLYLGAAVDAESDGQPSGTAEGDDTEFSNDERGVRFNTSLLPGRLASVTMIASEPGLIDAWIDFDRSGNWDAGDQVLTSTPVVAGRNTLNVAIPETAQEGTTFARFRLSSSGGLSATGPAGDGEVEDYMVEIQSAVANVFVLQQVTQVPEFETPYDPTMNADGTKVVFSSTADLTGDNPTGRNQLFLTDLTDETVTQLTDSRADASGPFYVASVRRPSVNADASKIAYVSHLINDTAPNYYEALTLYDAETDTSFLLHKDVYAEGPNISADGDRVLYWRWLDPLGAPTETHVYDAGSAPVPHTIFASQTPPATPAFSADGTTAGFVDYGDLTGDNPAGVTQLFLYDVDADSLTQVTDFTTNVYLASPSLSADGGRLAFTSNHDFTGENPTHSYEAFVLDTGTGIVSQLTSYPDDATYRVVLSADGTRFAYPVYANNKTDLYLGEIASGSTDLVTSVDDYVTPQLNADGTRIMFTTSLDLTGENPDQSREVYMVRSVPDADADGIGDEEENLGPNGGDGNNDQIPDSQQANVTSLVSRAGEYVTLESPAGTQLVDVKAIANPAPDTAPDEQSFPLGFLAFEVHGVTVGGSTTVTLHVPPGSDIQEYYKYGPLPSDPGNDIWYVFNYDGSTGAEILGDTIVLHFVDGQRGDSDLTGNGVVIEPGGPAVPTPRDFGDAPDPGYPTLITSDGARHAISSLFLGTTIDSEADGQPDAGASGDDSDGTNDDDGVSFVRGALSRTQYGRYSSGQ